VHKTGKHRVNHEANAVVVPGHRWAYVRSVINAEECPRTVCTCLTDAPPAMSAEA
jgi:hypothetical protein